MFAVAKGNRPHSVLRFTSLASLLLLAACGTDPVVRPRPGQSEDKATGSDDDESKDSSDSAGDDEPVDTGKIDGGKLDAGKPDAGKPDTSKTDAGKTDAGKTDAATPPQTGDLDAGHDTAGHDSATPTGTDAGKDAATVVVDAGAVLPPDPGKVAAKDVITLGDSWMSNTLQIEGTGGGIYPSLTSVSKQNYKNYAQQGVMLLEDSLVFGQAIPKQWDQALRANKTIKTVVMTAGGNDIIQNDALKKDCADGGAMCKAKLMEIGAALKSLWASMAAAGVKDIIHIAYAKSAGSGFKDADENAKSLAALCAAVPAPTRCRIMATDELVGPNGIAGDGIHPTQAANNRIATAIYKLMEDEHIAR